MRRIVSVARYGGKSLEVEFDDGREGAISADELWNYLFNTDPPTRAETTMDDLDTMDLAGLTRRAKTLGASRHNGGG